MPLPYTKYAASASMMVMRVNLRAALGVLCVTAALFTLYWSRCPPPTSPLVSSALLNTLEGSEGEVECVINGQYSVQCHRDANDVYLPFSFLHKYFEVYGKLTSPNRFEWSHSYSKVYHPKKKYEPRGTFITFENYNVEVRERVKCISGIEGVPVSTQWDPKGFYYPTQIAQFGLAHYSKNITEPEPKRRTIEDAEKVLANWIVTNDATMTREYNSKLNSNVLKWTTTEQKSSQVWAKLNIQEFVLSLDLMMKPNSSVTVVLQNKDKKETVYLHYVTSTELIYAQGEHIYHGMGTEVPWRRVTRDLVVDMQKGWALLERPKKKSPKTKYKISSIILYGSGSLDNMTLSSSEHSAMFFAAARWLVKYQRPRGGGWPVLANRKVAKGVELKPGWHSAMSQGHAISVLSRAYYRTGDETYLKAARKALYLLDVPAQSKGVKAVWMDKYVWYEEYPTNPPLFVLNGFIYTLLGLYDLHIIEGENSIFLAKKLFDDGMVSLKALLPLFDTGSGSFYDLRHFTLGVSPNIARWDYHATQVNQLYLLAMLDDDPILIDTAKRWEGYMVGKRAAHN